MIRPIVILVVLNLLIPKCGAQNCSEDFLLNRPGTLNIIENSTTGIPAADLAREKKIVTSFLDMIKRNYTPLGVDLDLGGAYESPDLELKANSYYLGVFPMQYYCENGVANRVHETANHFWIGANMFLQIIYADYTDESPNLPGFFSLRDMPVKKDGYWYFEEKITLNTGQPGISKTWLVTKEDQLPYSYVTKKEFLEKRKRLLLNDVDGRIANAKEGLAYVEDQKRIKEQEYKSDPEKWKSYFDNIYLIDKARYEKDILAIQEETDRAIRAIESQLKESAADELGQMAIVKMDSNDAMTFLFTSDDDPFGKVLIKPNPDYFDPKLPRSVPQFIGVYITGPLNEPVSFQAITQLENAVDFKALREMLGKI